MKRNKIKIIFLILIAFIISLYARISIAAINIVAAENVYGEVTKEIGGSNVNVISILNNLSQDPHLFTMSPSTAKAISNADIIIYNGADYDPWIQPVLAMKVKKPRKIIVVAQLIDSKAGANPHIWYQPETMPIFAKNLVTTLSQLDPQQQNYYQQQLINFQNNYRTLTDKIKQLKQLYQNTPVIATEPLFNDMADSIGLQMKGKDFQLSIMNDTPPSISQMQQFEDDLHQHTVRVLIYNNQIDNPLTRKMQNIAEIEGIPTVGVGEIMPKNMTYVQWMMQQLGELEKALARSQHE